MPMSIDEAIAHAREVAEKQRKDNENCKYKAEYGCKGCADYYSKPCIECAKEHEQLAEWLEELKELRKIKEDYAKGMQTSYATFMYNKAIDDMKSIVKNHNNTEKVSMVKLMNGKHNYYRAISVSKFCRLADRLKVGDHNA